MESLLKKEVFLLGFSVIFSMEFFKNRPSNSAIIRKLYKNIFLPASGTKTGEITRSSDTYIKLEVVSPLSVEVLTHHLART